MKFLPSEYFTKQFCHYQAAVNNRWTSGVTAVETSLIMLPFLVILFGIIEVSLIHLAASKLEGQVAAAARQIRTGQVQNSGDPINSFRRILCGETTFLDCDRVIIDVRNFRSFGEIQFRAFTNDQGTAENERFEPGNAGDTVLVRVIYQYQILTPFLNIYLGDGGRGSITLQSAAVFRSEPFGGNA